MPPVLFAALSYPFTQLAHALFPASYANGIIAGAFVFCKSPRCSVENQRLSLSLPDVFYDCMHYA